jgi:hypothetical protein
VNKAMLIKLAFRNIRANFGDYAIYLFTLIAFSFLFLSAFMLEILPIFQSVTGEYASNSLPILITLTLLCFMIYVNRFMLKRRSQELAIYMLTGINKKNICVLFFAEHAFLGVIALAGGLILGLILSFFVFNFANSTLQIDDIFSAILSTSIYFLFAHFMSLFIVILYMRRLEIKNLLDERKINENKKITSKSLILSMFMAISAYVIYILLLKQFAIYTVSLIAPTVGIFIYFFYKTIFDYVWFYREKHGKLLYRGKNLVISGQVMSKIRTNMRVCVVISCCLVTALCAWVAGYVFAVGDAEFLGGKADIAMGFVQMYISVIFTIIVFAVTALRQVLESREYRENYTILNHLGANKREINLTVFSQIIINFTLPILAVILISVGGIGLLEVNLNSFFEDKNVITQGSLIYFGIFAFFYFGYTAVVFNSKLKLF